MGSIQLCRDLRGKPAALQRLRREFRVRGRRQKISAHSKKEPNPAFMHSLDRLDRVGAVFARRVETEFRTEFGEELLVHPFPNSHRPVALDV